MSRRPVALIVDGPEAGLRAEALRAAFTDRQETFVLSEVTPLGPAVDLSSLPPVTERISTAPHLDHWTTTRSQDRASARRLRQIERGHLRASNGVDLRRRLDL